MTENIDNLKSKPGSDEYQEIDFLELWLMLWSNKLKLIAVVSICAFLSIIYTLSLPNIYRAQAVFAPSSENIGKVTGLMGQLGGIAGLAGIDLQSGDNKVAKSMELINSWSFISEFIKKNQLEVEIFAVENWDFDNNELIYDERVYDPVAQTWYPNAKGHLRGKPPTSWKLYEEFKDRLTVKQERLTGFVTISVEHYSPELSKKILELLVKGVNNYMREQDTLEAERSIVYLNEKIAETGVSEMKTMLYELIEQQNKILMLANVSDEYVLKTLSAAMEPEEKASPRRSLIVIVSTFLGGVFASLIVLVFGLKGNLAFPKNAVSGEEST